MKIFRRFLAILDTLQPNLINSWQLSAVVKIHEKPMCIPLASLKAAKRHELRLTTPK